MDHPGPSEAAPCRDPHHAPDGSRKDDETKPAWGSAGCSIGRAGGCPVIDRGSPRRLPRWVCVGWTGTAFLCHLWGPSGGRPMRLATKGPKWWPGSWCLLEVQADTFPLPQLVQLPSSCAGHPRRNPLGPPLPSRGRGWGAAERGCMPRSYRFPAHLPEAGAIL